MNTNLFRKVSIEKLSSPEKLDQLVTVISPRGWVLLMGILIMISALVIWAFIGTIDLIIEGKGILLNEEGIRGISHEKGGAIVAIKVSEGEYVKKGQVIATLSKPDIIEDIMQNQIKLEELKKQNDKSLKSNIKELEISIEVLKKQLEFESKIFSSYSGKIIEIKSSVGDIIFPGQSIASIEPQNDSNSYLEGFMYITAEESDRIKEGMNVKIFPAFLENNEYGYIKGVVVKVSKYPVTKEGMIKRLENQELVNSFLKVLDVPVEVKIRLVTDSTSFSGYKWSTKAGPKINISSKLLFNAQIVINRLKPVDFIFPIYKRG